MLLPRELSNLLAGHREGAYQRDFCGLPHRGATIAHLIRTRHWSALDTLAPDMARAFASAEALRVIARELPDVLAQRVAEVLAAELTKQGY